MLSGTNTFLNANSQLRSARWILSNHQAKKGIKPTVMMDVSLTVSLSGVCVYYILPRFRSGCNIPPKRKSRLITKLSKMAEELNERHRECFLSGEKIEHCSLASLTLTTNSITMEEISIIGHTCAKKRSS